MPSTFYEDGYREAMAGDKPRPPHHPRTDVYAQEYLLGYRDALDVKGAVSDKWQSTDNAPKDGTVILLTDGKFVYAGCWDENQEPEHGVAYPWILLDGPPPHELNGWRHETPTHWMELPSPPTE